MHARPYALKTFSHPPRVSRVALCVCVHLRKHINQQLPPLAQHNAGTRTVHVIIGTGQLVQPATGMATAADPHPHIWQPGIWPWPQFTACGGLLRVWVSQKLLALRLVLVNHSWTLCRSERALETCWLAA